MCKTIFLYLNVALFTFFLIKRHVIFYYCKLIVCIFNLNKPNVVFIKKVFYAEIGKAWQ